ncbi:MAG: NAD(P)/FAD-dependent oxidoreductase [Bifidobacterium aquikefiri]|uniref:NAD(P)/FAD-dependent oxidoreductase n=1 Tax=Bifidobacterium aquikefiri TaxID=1653207 RepID=UPI000B9C0F3F|nr:NAD(P)/FAD-dependent oxidoreductase [Bifidobacterium aquikefiri]
MKTIAVLGGGYAGLRLVKCLTHRKVDAHIVLINNNKYHYESTQLHEVAVGNKEPSDISFDIRAVLPDSVDFIVDTVTSIDRESQQVKLKNSQPVAYDYLVNALGFESESFGIKGVEEYSLSFNNIDSALAVRDRIEHTLANYATSHDENDLHIIVCGAGFTGIELLGELVERIPVWNKQYNLPEDGITVDCIEAGKAILPMLPDNLSAWAVKFLTDHGIRMHSGTPITEVRQHSVMSSDKEFGGNIIIWTTGIQGSHVICESGYAQKRNRVVVENNLAVKGHPNEFLIGDVAAVPNPDSGRFYPTTAQIAVAQADCAAKNIAALLLGKPTHDFQFSSVGTVCSLGSGSGVAQIDEMGHWKLKGHKVGLLKRLVNDRSVLELAHFKEMLASR